MAPLVLVGIPLQPYTVDNFTEFSKSRFHHESRPQPVNMRGLALLLLHSCAVALHVERLAWDRSPPPAVHIGRRASSPAMGIFDALGKAFANEEFAEDDQREYPPPILLPLIEP